jgi:hypothetical protein
MLRSIGIMPNDKLPQFDEKHPQPWRDDLNPNHMAGQNIGGETLETDPDVAHARDLKEIGRLLPGFTDAELREIPLVPTGTRLENHATYVDLCDPERRPFTATAPMVAPHGTLLVAKAEVPYQYWNRIIGLSDPRRTEIG